MGCESSLQSNTPRRLASCLEFPASTLRASLTNSRHLAVDTGLRRSGLEPQHLMLLRYLRRPRSTPTPSHFSLSLTPFHRRRGQLGFYSTEAEGLVISFVFY